MHRAIDLECVSVVMKPLCPFPSTLSRKKEKTPLTTMLDQHLIAYYIGIIILLLVALLLAFPKQHSHVTAQTYSALVLMGTLLVAYQFCWAQGYISW